MWELQGKNHHTGKEFSKTSGYNSQHIKSLEVIISSLTIRKSEQTENQCFSWTHQRNEATVQTATLNYGEESNSRELQPRCAYLEQKPQQPYISW